MMKRAQSLYILINFGMEIENFWVIKKWGYKVTKRAQSLYISINFGIEMNALEILINKFGIKVDKFRVFHIKWYNCLKVANSHTWDWLKYIFLKNFYFY